MAQRVLFGGVELPEGGVTLQTVSIEQYSIATEGIDPVEIKSSPQTETITWDQVLELASAGKKGFKLEEIPDPDPVDDSAEKQAAWDAVLREQGESFRKSLDEAHRSIFGTPFDGLDADELEWVGLESSDDNSTEEDPVDNDSTIDKSAGDESVTDDAGTGEVEIETDDEDSDDWP
jgi:hypothetical protein